MTIFNRFDKNVLSGNNTLCEELGGEAKVNHLRWK